MKKYYSVKQAAEYLPFSESFLRQHLKKTFIEGVHFVRKYGKIVFTRDGLDAWMEADDGKYHQQSRNSLDKFISELKEVS